MWYKFENATVVRGKKYDQLLNIENGSNISIDISKCQKDDDMNLTVFTEFPGMSIDNLFTGTEVECIRIIDKLGLELNAKEMKPWD